MTIYTKNIFLSDKYENFNCLQYKNKNYYNENYEGENNNFIDFYNEYNYFLHKKNRKLTYEEEQIARGN